MPDETPATPAPTSPAPATPAPTSPAPAASAPVPPPSSAREAEGTLGVLKLAPIVLVGIALGVYFMRPASPSARLESELARARAKIGEGRYLEAAPILEAVARDRSVPDARLHAEAASDLAKLVDRAIAEKHPLAEVGALLDAQQDIAGESAAPETAAVASATLSRAVDRVTQELAADPTGAVVLATQLLAAVEGTDLEAKVQEARTRALDAVIARDPNDAAALSARAAIELGEGRLEEARARLEPVAGKLGGSDGARVLGLARLKTGHVNEAIAPLGSYFEATLPALDRATQGCEATFERVVQRAELDPELTLQYRTLRGDEAKRAAHDAFVRKALDQDRSFKRARQAVVALAPMVEVGVALAQVEIARARGKSADERKAALERANHYLDGVGRVGSETDNWWVWFARIRIEQGNLQDVEQVVDAYVRTFRGSYRALFVAAELLAEAGDLEPARARAEAAVEKASVPADRERAAELRARVADSADEQLRWLDQAGSRPQIVAMKAQARASLALGDGRFEDAAAAFDEARSFYESEPGKLTAPPVHAALLALARAEATGKRADLDAAIASLEGQVKEEPVSLAALDALADALQARAVATVVGDRVQSDLLRDRSLDLLDMAAADEKEAAALAQALAASPDFARARELRERSTVETPRRPRPYAALVALAWKTRDADRLEGLLARIQKATLDRTEEARQVQELWSGKRDDAQKRLLAPRRKRADAVVALARASGHGPTLASALGVRSALEREAASLGAEADLDLAVKLAAEAHAAAPRRATRLELRNALLARAVAHARPTAPALDGLAQKFGKVGFVTVLTWAVRGDAALASKLAQDADVKQAIQLHAEASAEGEPQSNDARIYAIAGDARASEAASRIKGSRLVVGAVRANALLLPEGPEIVNELANVLEATGDAAARTKALEDAKKAAVPLPYDALAR